MLQNKKSPHPKAHTFGTGYLYFNNYLVVVCALLLPGKKEANIRRLLRLCKKYSNFIENANRGISILYI